MSDGMSDAAHEGELSWAVETAARQLATALQSVNDWAFGLPESAYDVVNEELADRKLLARLVRQEPPRLTARTADRALVLAALAQELENRKAFQTRNKGLRLSSPVAQQALLEAIELGVKEIAEAENALAAARRLFEEAP